MSEKNFSMGYMGVNCGWKWSFTIGNTNPIGIPLGIVAENGSLGHFPTFIIIY